MQRPRVQYAGFWERFFATLIDGVVLCPAVAIVSYISCNVFISPEWAGSLELAAVFILPAVLLSYVIASTVVVSWLYYALLESSNLGATLGKGVMGIKVTDLNGEKISFVRATGRFLGKTFFCLVFIIFIMPIFSSKKQGLHDTITGCLVVHG
jgi:uncharacterized RDD family membrane protein YckC